MIVLNKSLQLLVKHLCEDDASCSSLFAGHLSSDYIELTFSLLKRSSQGMDARQVATAVKRTLMACKPFTSKGNVKIQKTSPLIKPSILLNTAKPSVSSSKITFSDQETTGLHISSVLSHIHQVRGLVKSACPDCVQPISYPFNPVILRMLNVTELLLDKNCSDFRKYSIG